MNEENMGQKLFNIIEENRPLTKNEKQEKINAKIKTDTQFIFNTIKSNIIELINEERTVDKKDFKGKSIFVYTNRTIKNPILITAASHQIKLDVNSMFDINEANKAQFQQFKQWLVNNNLSIIAHYEYDDATNVWSEIYVSPMS